MRDLQGYRDHVYTYLDVEQEDIDQTLIDSWVRDGFRKIIYQIKRWPFYEQFATFSTVVDQRDYDLPVNIVDLRSIEAPWGMLDFLDEATARDRFHLYSGTVSRGRARAWSLWADNLRIWPLPDSAEELTVVGYRAPRDWVADGSGGVPDFPEQFEDALLAWVLHKAQRHQDDLEASVVALDEFRERLDELIGHEIQTPSAFPLVLGSGGLQPARQLPRRLAYPWE